MKTRIAAAFIVLAAVQIGMAAEPGTKLFTTERKIELARKNLKVGLQSDNIGVLESAMRVTAQLKMRFPAAEVPELVGLLDEITVNHPSGIIRYQAYIASSVCADPEWYSKEQSVTSANDEDFFRAASKRLQQKYFSTAAL